MISRVRITSQSDMPVIIAADRIGSVEFMWRSNLGFVQYFAVVALDVGEAHTVSTKSYSSIKEILEANPDLEDWTTADAQEVVSAE